MSSNIDDMAKITIRREAVADATSYNRSPRVAAKHRRGWAAVMLLLTGCGVDAAHDDTQAVAPKTPRSSTAHAVVDPERGGSSSVTIQWQDVRSGMTLRDADSLKLDVANTTGAAQSVRIVTVSSGLDGRLVERPLTSVQLEPEAHQLLQLAVSSIPIQSDGSSSFVSMQVELDREDGTVDRIPTRPLYYTFRNQYSEASFYDENDVAALAPGDLFDVRGRVLEANRQWTDVNGIGPSGQGLSRVVFAPHVSDPNPVYKPTDGPSTGAKPESGTPQTGSESVAVATAALSSSVRV